MADRTEQLTSKQRAAARKVARLNRQVQVSGELQTVAQDSHTHYSVIARACAIDASKVSRWADTEKQTTPTIADLHLMPSHIAHALLRSVAKTHGLVVSTAPAAVGVDMPHVRRMAAFAKEAGEAQGAYAAFVLGHGSRCAAIREARESLEVHASILASLESEKVSA